MGWLKRRRIWLITAGVSLGWAGVVAWQYVETRAEAERELARVTAELDATDPGWRLDDLIAAHNAAVPPDDENATVLVESVRPRVPADFRTISYKLLWNGGRGPRPLNRRPAPDTLRATSDARHRWADVLADARRLRDRPRGGVRYPLPSYPLIAFLPSITTLEVVRLLEFDALAAADVGEADQAVVSLRATVNSGHGTGCQFVHVNTMIRVAADVMAATAAERVLARCEPRAGLGELQAALADEAAAPILADSVRGERAWAEQVFAAVEGERLTYQQVVAPGPPKRLNAVNLLRHLPYLPADHAFELERSTRSLDVLRRPMHEWRDGATAFPPPPDDYWHLISRQIGLSAAIDRYITEAVKNQAVLRIAVAGLACERFRQASGRWPATLQEVPTAILPAVPLDPWDGQPLRLARTADGVVIYSVGEDGTDDGGRPARAKGEPGGVDVTFRLWDPAARGVPAEVPGAAAGR